MEGVSRGAGLVPDQQKTGINGTGVDAGLITRRTVLSKTVPAAIVGISAMAEIAGSSTAEVEESKQRTLQIDHASS